MEWGAVTTPSWADLVILPSSDILDYAVGGAEGDIIYAVLELDSDCTEVGYEYDSWGTFALVKSDDGGITWTDITANVVGASSLPDEEDIYSLNLVAIPSD